MYLHARALIRWFKEPEKAKYNQSWCILWQAWNIRTSTWASLNNRRSARGGTLSIYCREWNERCSVYHCELFESKTAAEGARAGPVGIAGNQVISSNIYDKDWRTTSLRYILAVLVNTFNINAWGNTFFRSWLRQVTDAVAVWNCF